MAAFLEAGKPVLWGEASPDGAVVWHPSFHLESIDPPPVEQQEEIAALFTEMLGEGYAGDVGSLCDNHHRLVPGLPEAGRHLSAAKPA